MTDDEAELAALAIELADALRSAADVVDDVADSGRAAYALHDVHGLEEELAELAFDTRLEQAATLRDAVGAPPGGPAGPRVMVFHATGLSVELEIDAEQILGQLVPAGPAVVTFDAPSGPVVRAVVDEFGFFSVPAPPPQPLRMRCAAPSGVLRTDWFLA